MSLTCLSWKHAGNIWSFYFKTYFHVNWLKNKTSTCGRKLAFLQDTHSNKSANDTGQQWLNISTMHVDWKTNHRFGPLCSYIRGRNAFGYKPELMCGPDKKTEFELGTPLLQRSITQNNSPFCPKLWVMNHEASKLSCCLEALAASLKDFEKASTERIPNIH